MPDAASAAQRKVQPGAGDAVRRPDHTAPATTAPRAAAPSPGPASLPERGTLLGFDFGQGFFWSRPVPEDKVAATTPSRLSCSDPANS